MKRCSLITLSVLVLGLLEPQIAGAQTPNLVHYQGVLSDSTGTPVTDSNYNLTFGIYDLPAGGILLWGEAAIVTTQAGRFNHFLGRITPLPGDLFNAHDSLFLELSVGGQIIAPRTRLVSVGYTRRVSSVDAALGGTISGEVTVEESSSAAFTNAVHGILTSATPGANSAAVRGENQGTNTSGYGVWGSHDAGGMGIYGASVDGRGVYGASTNGVAGYFKSFGASPSALYVETGGAGDAAQFKEGDVVLIDVNGNETIELDSQEGSSGGQIVLRKADGKRTVAIDAAENGRAQVSLYHTDGLIETVEILGTQVSDTTGGIISLRNERGNVTVQIDGEEGNTGGQIILQTNDGAGTIQIDGEYGAGGQGRMTIDGSLDASLAVPNSGYLLLGTPGGTNVIFDDNEIMARSGSLSSPLYLQNDAGQVVIGGAGVGSLPSDYILLVDGKAILEEVEVQLSTVWPDYVFDDGYDLMPLDQLEAHVRSAGHLPGIPSAADMEDAALPLGEMQTRLLEKVEELTLYVIDLKKELDLVRIEKDRLEAVVSGLGAGR
jgi:hypothetical protein